MDAGLEGAAGGFGGSGLLRSLVARRGGCRSAMLSPDDEKVGWKSKKDTVCGALGVVTKPFPCLCFGGGGFFLSFFGGRGPSSIKAAPSSSSDMESS